MTPALPFFDAQTERLLMRALLEDPSRQDRIVCALPELLDLHAQSVFEAFANIRARGENPTRDAVIQELTKTWTDRLEQPVLDYQRYELITKWTGVVDGVLALPPPASEAEVSKWDLAVFDLAEARREAITRAEPVPTRAPRGPRADNAEPTRLAEAFRRFRYELDGEATLVRWARAWWRYDGTRYVEHDDESLDRDLIGFLDIVVAPHRDPKTGRTSYQRVTSRNKTVGEVRKALLHVMPGVAASSPHWTSCIEGDPDPGVLAPCANGILNLDTLELLPKTPRLFSSTAIATAWDPTAEAPTWHEFLHSLWGDDRESPLALQQMFGYFLTGDTSQQKLFMLQGLKRSGKGTIARVLKALLGDDATVNPTLDSLEETFGLAPFVGKSVAIIGDARLGGRSEQAQIVERLLSISGEDSLSVNRKNRDAINVRMRVRVLLLSNELPQLYDTSGALADRFVIMVLPQSFLGREDTTLERRLLAELPGIFRWAAEGRQDLAERGRFIVPLASERALGLLRASGSPLSVFVEECCSVAPEQTVSCQSLWDAWVAWCKANGRERPGTRQGFFRDLHTLYPELDTVQYRKPDQSRARRVDGIGLSDPVG